MNWQENKDINIENSNITTSIQEAVFEALEQRGKNKIKNQE